MATEDNFIVAIELGSSKVTGLVGRKQPDGAIQILASIQEPSASFIRKGRINNLNKMTSCATLIKEKLEKTLKKTISGCYVGVGGMGMHTVENTVVRHFPDKMHHQRGRRWDSRQQLTVATRRARDPRSRTARIQTRRTNATRSGRHSG